MRFLLILMLFTTIKAHSQTLPEIYDFITKDYKSVLAQGLGFKKGYDYKEIIKGNEFNGAVYDNTFQFVYYKVFKKGEPLNTRAFMVTLLKKGAVEKVFCLPAANSSGDLWGAFYSDVDLNLFIDQKDRMYQEIANLFVLMVNAVEKK